jgi:hypothetical protein
MQRARRAFGVQDRPVRRERVADGALAPHARAAGGAGEHVRLDEAPVADGDVAVDIGSDQRVNRSAVRH